MIKNFKEGVSSTIKSQCFSEIFKNGIFDIWYLSFLWLTLQISHSIMIETKTDETINKKRWKRSFCTISVNLYPFSLLKIATTSTY